MVADLIRDAPLGQIVRLITRNRVFQYPEEKDDWQCPRAEYGGTQPTKTISEPSTNEPTPANEKGKLEFPLAPNTLSSAPTHPDAEGTSSAESEMDVEASRNLSRIMTRPQLSRINTQATLAEAYQDAIRQETIKTQPSRALVPERTADNRILVTWYTTDDQANPQNWSQGKRALVILQIYMYTLAIYIAGAIYTPAIPTLIEKFNISPTVASLGLSMYVLAYGLGALVFSPMSEIPVIGRNPPYMVTFFIFLIITVPLGLINNFAGFVVLRFFQGFFGSPALATGGASITDIYSLLQMPYFLTGWAAFATAGPALGPLISGFSVPAENWHWSMWEILWLGGPIFVSLMICLPETSSPAILLQRAQRLRKRLIAQGKTAEAAQLVAQSELDQSTMTFADITKDNLLRPFQINILDPAVGFTSVYIGLIYGIFYSFFECFPLVYGAGLPAPSITRGYGMNLGEQGLIFLSVAVGVSMSVCIYIWYLHYHANPALRAQLAKGQLGAPEARLVPGLYASVLAPASLFMFAWTGFNSPDIHWIVPTIGIVLFVLAVFLVFQVVFIYLALTYPQYSASLFAMNDAVRSSVAAGSIHFSLPLFHNLGIGRGGSLLGGLMVMGVIGIYGLWVKGAWLRGKSKFAAS